MWEESEWRSVRKRQPCLAWDWACTKICLENRLTMCCVSNWGGQGVQHGCTEEEVESTLVEELCLQQPVVDVTELEDARWFHRSWLSGHLHHAGARSMQSCADITLQVLFCNKGAPSQYSMLKCLGSLHVLALGMVFISNETVPLPLLPLRREVLSGPFAAYFGSSAFNSMKRSHQGQSRHTQMCCVRV